MTPQQKAARLQLIREIAEKYENKNLFAKKMRMQAIRARKISEAQQLKEERQLDRQLQKLDENHNHWTDASAFAKQAVGDTFIATTRFDNDWD